MWASYSRAEHIAAGKAGYMMSLLTERSYLEAWRMRAEDPICACVLGQQRCEVKSGIMMIHGPRSWVKS
jgi:hypothetical protein